MREKVSAAVWKGMQRKGWSIGRLAKAAAIAPADLGARLRCEVAWDVEIVHRIAASLGVDVRGLLCGDSPDEFAHQAFGSLAQ